jgi:prolyl 4-hydroxylase
MDECAKEPMVAQISEKVREITGIPVINTEYLQLLEYKVGQEYKPHHDFIDGNHAVGPRVYTFFLYLSDVEKGGETAFDKLGIEVSPKRGKALLWPSVLDHDPSSVDERTHHQAKPVVEGLKYAANYWVHMYDFRGPHAWGCAG